MPTPMGTVTNRKVTGGYWLAPGQTSDTTLAELRAQVRAGAVKHSVMAGVDWRASAGIYGAFAMGNRGAIDLYNPIAVPCARPLRGWPFFFFLDWIDNPMNTSMSLGRTAIAHAALLALCGAAHAQQAAPTASTAPPQRMPSLPSP